MDAEGPSPGTTSPGRVLAIVGGITAAWIVLWGVHAWVSEDAFITFRVIRNALEGHGLRWNLAERVQVYTHPAWMLLILAGTAVSGLRPWDVAWAASLAGTVVTVAWVSRGLLGHAGVHAVLAWTVLASASRAVVHFTSSGLETPLLYAALAVALGASLWRPHPRRAACAVGIALLTRLDMLLLVGPVLALVVWTARPADRRPLLALALGPALAWAAFSAVYYGFPLPNTAPAKLPHGVPRAEILAFGRQYAEVTARSDPWSVAALCGGMLAGLRAQAAARAWAMGIALTCAYLLWIGGDYYVGRLIAPPVLVGGVLLAQHVRSTGALVATAVAVAASSTVLPGSPWRAPFVDDGNVLPMDGGVYDQWGMWHLPRHRWDWTPNGPNATGEPPPMGPDVPAVRVEPWIGESGWYAPRTQHLVDPLGLADPLLARMRPATYHPGHARRPIPAGYLDAVATGDRPLTDPRLDAYWRDLLRLTRGPILGSGWLRAWWRLNVSAPGFLSVDEQVTRQAADDHDTPCVQVDATQLGPIHPDHPPDQHDVLHRIACGVRVEAAGARGPVTLGLSSGVAWSWTAFLEGAVVAHGTIEDPATTVQPRTVPIPAGAPWSHLTLRPSHHEGALGGLAWPRSDPPTD